MALTKREKNLRFKHGITIQEYNKLYNQQKGYCAICGKHQLEFKRHLAVDHNHNTNQIRGLLCGKCNKGLGHFCDNIELFQKAIKYLRGCK